MAPIKMPYSGARNVPELSGGPDYLEAGGVVALLEELGAEAKLIDRSEVEHITVEDIRNRSENIHAQMERLSSLVDLLYIHIDIDVLDPKEVEGHPLTVPNGPTSLELASALTEMFRYEKAAGLGIASTPHGENDRGGLSRQAAYNLIRGAIEDVRQRP